MIFFGEIGENGQYIGFFGEYFGEKITSFSFQSLIIA
jgi:hypothetical protein